MSASAVPQEYRVPPVLERPARVEFSIHGPMGERIAANTRNWLLVAPSANPAMLQMFRDRDRTPPRDLLPWSGEFAGKYLLSAVQALPMTKDRSLRRHLKAFVADLIATQRADGYLGPFPAAEGMTGPGRWDLWGQYHVMLGLFCWYKETGDKAALAACRKCADLFCRTFLDGGKRVVQAGSEEMNESSIHIFTLLYRETGEPRYLRMAREIEKDWETPPSGDYVRAALAGKPFWQFPKPRWESLHGVQAIAELYFLTGDAKYRRAYEQIWWSILEGDRHNTGGFSSGEQATGNPYDPRPIETCCTVAWMAVTLDYLRMTGDSRAADELELSTFNAILGAQNPEGRWWTYNTPMDGERKASAHDIVFQARPGSPELNCCAVNGPRGLGILSEWAVMTAKDGIALNWYGPGTITVRAPSGQKVRILVESGYPGSDIVRGHGEIRIHVQPEKVERFVLRLRIPGWSRQTRVQVNGEEQTGVRAGTYLVLDRTWSLGEWKIGDKIDLTLDMSPWLWVGERECAAKVAVYRGPLLLAYDPRHDAYDPGHLPVVNFSQAPKITYYYPQIHPYPCPILLLQFATQDGGRITLCDFTSAGMAGNRYVSWLPSAGSPKPVPFRRDNPLRAVWP
jgi:DUF1680 family protein